MGYEKEQPIRNEDDLFERRLVARLRMGDPDALGTLFERYVDRVFAFARYMLGNKEDAEEATSEVFVRAFDRATTLRDEGAFRGWLFRIARNICLDKLRQPRLLWLEDEDASSDEGVASRKMESQIAIKQALAELSEEHRVVLILCDMEEWDAKEVAEWLGKSLPATKSMLYRARQALRGRLAGAWGEEETNVL